MTKRGKQASRKAAARKYGFLEVPVIQLQIEIHTGRCFVIIVLSVWPSLRIANLRWLPHAVQDAFSIRSFS
ncbi:MAG: hypothetical protein Q8K59_00135 [Nitrosomonas sp.]|nr:hypothetical protein [Nitrosomonas sp.]MDP1949511.1 hypothetical protein [Nitrosomonas sp.]